MKRLLLATASLLALVAARPALSADLGMRAPVKAPPVVGVPIFTWTGCYVGGHIGWGWGRKTFSDTPDGFLVDFTSGVDSLRADTDGFLGGGQIGCNYQFATPWVIGFEGDVSAANISGSVGPFLFAGGPAVNEGFRAKTEWIASATGRLGYAWDRWLLYVKGGAAWAGDKYSATTYAGSWAASETRSGWTIGAGLEWAFADNWSARLEYDFYDFGHRDVTGTFLFFGDPIPATISVKQEIQAVKFGINYRFGAAGPVSARY
jgi:outer membrane immunogenic protein